MTSARLVSVMHEGMTVFLILRLLFGGMLAVSIGGCKKNSPGTTTPSGAVPFGTEGSKVGAVEVGEYTVTLDLNYTLEGLAGPRVSTSILRSARYRTEFVAVKDGLPFALKGAAVVFLEYGRPQNGDGTGSFQAAFDPAAGG